MEESQQEEEQEQEEKKEQIYKFRRAVSVKLSIAERHLWWILRSNTVKPLFYGPLLKKGGLSNDVKVLNVVFLFIWGDPENE